jgi:hypothetical protein
MTLRIQIPLSSGEHARRHALLRTVLMGQVVGFASGKLATLHRHTDEVSGCQIVSVMRRKHGCSD